MKRLIIATVALLILAGVTYWTLGQKPEMSPELIKKMKTVSKFKETLPVAETGDVNAQYAVGVMYEKGDGTKKNPKEAVKWLQKAADKGHALSRYQLGMMYLNGDSVRQDYFLAAKYFRLAASFNKLPDAQYRLGELYFNGRGVENNYAKAISYYRQAAQNGHAAAQFVLSAMYQEGWGVQRDLIESYMWLKLAMAHPQKAMAINPKYDPVRKMANLKPKLNNFQINEAEKRLAEMKRR